MKLNLEPLIRFMKHLPKTGDVELSVLKCHLLVEEMLNKLIERNARHPDYVMKARLTFFQKVWMARSLSNLESDAWVWKAVLRLNEARNSLTHGLEHGKTEGKLEAFVAFVEAEQGAPEREELSQAFGRFHWAVFKVFTRLAAHAHFDPSTLRIRLPTLLTATEGEAAAALPAQPQAQDQSAPLPCGALPWGPSADGT